jgi:hypothetical protein
MEWNEMKWNERGVYIGKDSKLFVHICVGKSPP